MQKSGQVFTDKEEGMRRTTTNLRNMQGILEVPRREGAFSINKKEDGLAYIDHKTKARKFDMTAIQRPYNPNRLIGTSTLDAIIDPNITIRHEKLLPLKDPGY